MMVKINEKQDIWVLKYGIATMTSYLLEGFFGAYTSEELAVQAATHHANYQEREGFELRQSRKPSGDLELRHPIRLAGIADLADYLIQRYTVISS